jgi:hypothetical protein
LPPCEQKWPAKTSSLISTPCNMKRAGRPRYARPLFAHSVVEQQAADPFRN